MSREGLYKALLASGNLTFATVVRIARAGPSAPHRATVSGGDTLRLTRASRDGAACVASAAPALSLSDNRHDRIWRRSWVSSAPTRPVSHFRPCGPGTSGQSPLPGVVAPGRDRARPPRTVHVRRIRDSLQHWFPAVYPQSLAESTDARAVALPDHRATGGPAAKAARGRPEAWDLRKSRAG